MKLFLIALVLIALFLLALLSVQPAAAQGTVPPTPQPVNPIDKARADANQWEAIANQAVASAQAAIGQAYSAIASAEAGLAQAQMAAQQEHAARVAAEQGQIQQAVESAQAALVSSNQATAIATDANKSAIASLTSAHESLSAIRQLRQVLNQTSVDVAGLTATTETQQARIMQLERYGWTMYRETVTAWAVAGVLGFVLIAVLMSILIVIAAERRNRWPRFRDGIKSALIVPVKNH